MHLATLRAITFALIIGAGISLSSTAAAAPATHQQSNPHILFSIAAQATTTTQASATIAATGTTAATDTIVATSTTTNATSTTAPTGTVANATNTTSATNTIAVTNVTSATTSSTSTPPTPSVGVAATSPITATTTDVAGAIVTATSPVTNTQSTPPPVQTAVPQAAFQGNFLDPNFLFSAPPRDAPIGPLAWAYLASMLALLAASVYFYMFKRPQWKGTNSILYKAANTWGQTGLWVGGIGLLFLLFRAISLDFFNLRFWLYLWMLVALIAAVAFFYWYRTIYPRQKAKYQKVQRARQYMPAPARASIRQPSKTSTKVKVAPAPERPAQTPTATPSNKQTPKPQQKANKSRKRR